MARFMASVTGHQSATRLGSAETGVTVRAQSRTVGVEVQARADGDADVFTVVAAVGGRWDAPTRLGTVRVVAGVPTFTPAPEDTRPRKHWYVTCTDPRLGCRLCTTNEAEVGQPHVEEDDNVGNRR